MYKIQIDCDRCDGVELSYKDLEKSLVNDVRDPNIEIYKCKCGNLIDMSDFTTCRISKDKDYYLCSIKVKDIITIFYKGVMLNILKEEDLCALKQLH